MGRKRKAPDTKSSNHFDWSANMATDIMSKTPRRNIFEAFSEFSSSSKIFPFNFYIVTCGAYAIRLQYSYPFTLEAPSTTTGTDPKALDAQTQLPDNHSVEVTSNEPGVHLSVPECPVNNPINLPVTPPRQEPPLDEESAPKTKSFYSDVEISEALSSLPTDKITLAMEQCTVLRLPPALVTNMHNVKQDTAAIVGKGVGLRRRQPQTSFLEIGPGHFKNTHIVIPEEIDSEPSSTPGSRTPSGSAGGSQCNTPLIPQATNPPSQSNGNQRTQKRVHSESVATTLDSKRSKSQVEFLPSETQPASSNDDCSVSPRLSCLLVRASSSRVLTTLFFLSDNHSYKNYQIRLTG